MWVGEWTIWCFDYRLRGEHWCSAGVWVCSFQGWKKHQTLLSFGKVWLRCVRKKLSQWPLHSENAGESCNPSQVCLLPYCRFWICSFNSWISIYNFTPPYSHIRMYFIASISDNWSLKPISQCFAVFIWSKEQSQLCLKKMEPLKVRNTRPKLVKN